MQIDTELLSDAVEQGFKLEFEHGKCPFWDRDEVKQEFFYYLPNGTRSRDFKSFEAFQDHLRMSVKKKREGTGTLMVSQ